jgi:nucleoside-diphosphate-sugar epimerase
MMPPRLLVIGGSGFIGQHVVRRGMSKGWEVISLGLNTPDNSKIISGVHYIEADLTQVDSLQKIVDSRFDYIVNLGGYIDHALFCSGGRRLIHSHFDGLLNLLELLDRTAVKRFVQIGSSDEYGNALAPQNVGLRERPISPYSLAKAAATHFLQMLHRTEGFPVVTLRLFLAYGPGQDERRFIPQIIRGCLNDSEFPVSAGAQIRDFCYVEDAVNAIFLALDSDLANGEIFNVGSGVPITIKALIEQICSIIGMGRPKFGVVPYRVGENMALYADLKKIRNLLGWEPQTSLDAGLHYTIDSMRRTHV